MNLFCDIYFTVFLALRIFRQFGVPWASIYDYAGIRLVTSQSLYTDEFLWLAQFSGSLLAMGAARILRYFGQYNLGRSNGHGRWSRLLFFGRRFSKATWWLPNP